MNILQANQANQTRIKLTFLNKQFKVIDIVKTDRPEGKDTLNIEVPEGTKIVQINNIKMGK